MTVKFAALALAYLLGATVVSIQVLMDYADQQRQPDVYDVAWQALTWPMYVWRMLRS